MIHAPFSIPALRPSTPRLKIGISACFLHPDPTRTAFASKTLQYLEQSMAHWVMAGGAMPVLIPSTFGQTSWGNVGLSDYAQWLDGLILHGGADMWPGHYGESALRPEWRGDVVRDDYEIALTKAFVAANKPVFGICRGLQLINVVFGGSLYQDLSTQRPDSLVHHDAQTYDEHFHTLEIVPNTHLSALLKGGSSYKINSIHHQGIKGLAPGFVAEAHCADDGMIEAIRHTGEVWVAGVQWHPEFHPGKLGVMDGRVLLQDFLNAATERRVG